MAEEKFIRVASGAVYRYCDRLMTRKDAVVVTGHEAAKYFRSIGAKNDITRKYPEREVDKDTPVKRRKANNATTSRPKRKEAASGMLVTDVGDPVPGLDELLGNEPDVSTGD